MSCSLFGFIQGLIIPNNKYLSMMRGITLSEIVLDITLLSIIFTAADMPVNEVNVVYSTQIAHGVNLTLFYIFLVRH